MEEVDALTPGSPRLVDMALPAPSRAPSRLRLAAYVLIPLLAAAVGTAVRVSNGGPPRCTFADGTYVDGACMFIDEFDSFNTQVWKAANDWSGPLQAVIPDVGCFREENVTVSGNALRLAMTVNARSSCPTSWSSTSYYTTHEYTPGTTYATSWPLGAATSYDVAAVDMRDFRMKYGRVQMRITLPPGRGPGGDVTLWGIACQQARGSVGALSDLFTKDTADRTCNWPVNAAEMDIIQSSRSGATTTINTSTYTSNAVGSPTLVGNFFGINYYGARWAQPATAGFTTWLGGTVTNPTTTYHIYDLLWTPSGWSLTVDGTLQTTESAAWIPSGSMFMMLWNAATVPVTAADLPSTMLVDYIRISCPIGVPCTWSGTGSS